jgi:hypothetical protein
MRAAAIVLLPAVLTAAMAAALATACGGGGGGGSSPGDGGATDANPGDSTLADGGGDAGDAGAADAAPDAPPKLGTQIDRAGRPGINPWLDHVFDTNGATRGAANDAYNADGVPAHWPTYAPALAASLAVYDGLDTTCGNQMLYTPAAGYAPFSALLADDQLYLDTAQTTCAQYFAVELGAKDCGGRTPGENTVDDTYNLLAGSYPATPLTNGIKTPASPPAAAFPYFAAPH